MRLLLILSFFLLSLSVSSEAETLYVGSENEYALTPYAETYGDVSKKMDIEDVQKEIWKNIDVDTLSFPISPTAHWLKFNFENNTTEDKAYYLVYDVNHINYLDVYITQENKVLQSYSTGAYRPTSARPERYSKYLFPLTLHSGEKKMVYVRMQHYFGSVIADMSLVKKEALWSRDYFEHTFQAAFLAIILVMFLYNGVLYLMTGFAPYLAYLLYLGSFGIWLSLKMGYGMLLFNFENMFIYKNLELVTGTLFSAFILLFIMGVLDLKDKMPKANSLLKMIAYIFVFVWLSWTVLLFLEMFDALQIPTTILSVNFILMIFSVLVITFYLAVKGDQTAQFLFIAWIIFLLSILVWLMKMIALIPAYPWIDYLLLGSMALETVLFSLILGNRYRLQNKRYLEQTRLADMGSMIENIAHQWRQPLSGINADLFAMRIFIKNNDLAQVEEQMDEVEEKTEMMSNIIHDFSKFYTPNKVKETFSVKETIEKACEFNKKIFTGLELDCTLKLDPLLKIHGVENEYYQVVLAILSNARDALSKSEKRDKKIIVTLEKDSGFSVLSIYNNGPHIIEEDLRKIFNPYFTTKEEKMGSGIGLYMSKKIITEGFSGTITLNNESKGVKVIIKVAHA